MNLFDRGTDSADSRKVGVHMRKMLRSLLVAGALAALAAVPVHAGTDFCLIDPAVTVNGATVQVGLYTTDAGLLNRIKAPLQITILGEHGGSVTTSPADWSVRYSAIVRIENSLRRTHGGGTVPLEVDALVPSPDTHATVILEVTLPDGSVQQAIGHTDDPLSLTVQVPD
jgi:hypothetical protein